MYILLTRGFDLSPMIPKVLMQYEEPRVPITYIKFPDYNDTPESFFDYKISSVVLQQHCMYETQAVELPEGIYGKISNTENITSLLMFPYCFTTIKENFHPSPCLQCICLDCTD